MAWYCAVPMNAPCAKAGPRDANAIFPPYPCITAVDQHRPGRVLLRETPRHPNPDCTTEHRTATGHATTRRHPHHRCRRRHPRHHQRCHSSHSQQDCHR
nr:hypothetical protein XfCFBP8356_10665 [Xylella fastidiosa subsp. sandyi]